MQCTKNKSHGGSRKTNRGRKYSCTLHWLFALMAMSLDYEQKFEARAGPKQCSVVSAAIIVVMKAQPHPSKAINIEVHERLLGEAQCSL